MRFRLLTAICLACLSVFSLTAECHTRLLASYPKNGQVLSQAPDYVLIQFSKPIEKNLSQLQLSPDNGKSWITLESLKSPEKKATKNSAIDRSLKADLPALKPAKYQVRWRVLSRDGHMQRGQFSFELR